MDAPTVTILFLTLLCAVNVVRTQEDFDDSDNPTKCFAALKRYPKPDVTYTAKHLWNDCPELCRNSSGRFPTGQFTHPWDCNAFINCYKDDAWVHWCQVGLVFNEKNLQCDWPRNVDCSGRNKPDRFTAAPHETTTSQWEFITTPSSHLEIVDQENIVTCKDFDAKLNDKEFIGNRPDLCKEGSGDYAAPDCRFYVRCVGTKAYVARCPGGFVFNPHEKRCDWPNKNPKCLKACLDKDNYQVPDSPKTTPIPKPLITTTFATTLDPGLVNASCNESHCIPKAGCQKELCKQERGMFEVSTDCRKFANCWDSCAYISECPRGTVFNEAKRMCESPTKLPKQHKCYEAPIIVATQSPPQSGGYGVDLAQQASGPSMTQWQTRGNSVMQQSQ